MFGITGFETFEGESEFAWFDTMDEMMAWLEQFEVFSLDELTALDDHLWTLEG